MGELDSNADYIRTVNRRHERAPLPSSLNDKKGDRSIDQSIDWLIDRFVHSQVSCFLRISSMSPFVRLILSKSNRRCTLMGILLFTVIVFYKAATSAVISEHIPVTEAKSSLSEPVSSNHIAVRKSDWLVDCLTRWFTMCFSGWLVDQLSIFFLLFTFFCIQFAGI